MTLKKDDQLWISGEIKKQVDAAVLPLRPNRMEWWRNLGILALVVAVIGILLTVCIALGIELVHVATFQGKAEARLDEIERRLFRLDGTTAGLTLEHLSNQPIGPETVPEVKTALTMARNLNISVDQKTVVDLGAKLIKVSDSSPEAWNATLDLLNYRSFLNKDFQPTPSQLTPIPNRGANYSWMFHSEPNPAFVPTPEKPVLAFRLFSTGGIATRENSARLELLSRPQSGYSGISTVVVDAKADFLVLDDMYMKNAIVRNAVVIYKGGAVKLDNVVFVNCTFKHIANEPAGRRLSEQLLASASTTFAWAG